MKGNNSSSTTRFVIGIVGMVVVGIFLVAFLVGFLIFSIFGKGTVVLPGGIVLTVLFVLSTMLMNSGMRRKHVIGRLSRYLAELSTRQDVLSIDNMAEITGYLPMQIKNDMRLLKKWNLSFDMYTDKLETTLIKGKSSYNQYIETERQREALAFEEAERQSRLNDPETATLEAFKIEGVSILEKMRAANLLLPGESISNSLYELEKTTKRIFDHIENHPEKLPETRKLMNYHLPTTMKLIEKYCEYDTVEYQPQNVADAKADIEKALSAANEAFVNFLEGLYRVDTLDVTTDAEVLTKMFERDGLTGKKFDI
jgi:hypothetical protein